MQPGHHLAEDPATAVVGPDADPGDAGRTDLAARHGQPERVGGRAADPLVAIERADARSGSSSWRSASNSGWLISR